MWLAATPGDVSQQLQTVFTGGLLVATIAAVIAAWRQLGREQKAAAAQVEERLKNERRQRVHNLTDRTTTVEFIGLMSQALKVFRGNEDAWRESWGDRALNAEGEMLRRQLAVLAVLNFFEEIAGEYVDGLLDKEVADKNLAYVATSMWKASERFVKFYRCETKEKRAWDRLEAFANAWRVPEAVGTTPPASRDTDPGAPAVQEAGYSKNWAPLTNRQENLAIAGIPLVMIVALVMANQGGGARSAATIFLAVYSAAIVMVEQTGVCAERGGWRVAKISATVGALGVAFALSGQTVNSKYGFFSVVVPFAAAMVIVAALAWKVGYVGSRGELEAQVKVPSGASRDELG